MSRQALGNIDVRACRTTRTVLRPGGVKDAGTTRSGVRLYLLSGSGTAVAPPVRPCCAATARERLIWLTLIWIKAA